MTRTTRWTGLAVAASLLLGACELDIQNPNAPDVERAYSDPATISAVAGGTIKDWLNDKFNYSPTLTLSTMADALTASWNNFNIRYYSSYDSDPRNSSECPERCGWANDPTSSFRVQIEPYWYDAYSWNSAANDALTAIRVNNVDLGADTKMVETIAQMSQGLAHAWIALNYDQGFVVTETTDLSDPASLPLTPRDQMRDEAFAMLESAYQLASANSFSTPATWTGSVNGISYSNTQIAQLIRTLQAELLANYPRNAQENGQVNWATVAQLASQGISSGAGFDFEFYSDGSVFCHCTLDWGNDLTTMRLDTRVAAEITTNHVTPHPFPANNPVPISNDARVGNGGNCVAPGLSNTNPCDAGSGTDFTYASNNPYPQVRGVYHYSQLAHTRFDACVWGSYGHDGQCTAPGYLRSFNDLLWAEGLARSNQNLALAAQLINNTRVTRGGMPAVSAADGQAALIAAVRYEQLVENIYHGATPFFQRRRLDELWAMTPRHMPIPAKELQILQFELYTFGGPDDPSGIGAAPPAFAHLGKVKNVREIAKGYQEENLKMVGRKWSARN